jgi:hypothetical protein
VFHGACLYTVFLYSIDIPNGGRKRDFHRE